MWLAEGNSLRYSNYFQPIEYLLSKERWYMIWDSLNNIGITFCQNPTVKNHLYSAQVGLLSLQQGRLHTMQKWIYQKEGVGKEFYRVWETGVRNRMG